MVLHHRRHRPIWQAHIAGWAKHQKLVFGDFGIDRRALGFPIGDQADEANRIDNCARENMRADFRALFEDDDRDVFAGAGCELFQADRGG